MQKNVKRNRPTRGLTRLRKREAGGLQWVVYVILLKKNCVYMYLYSFGQSMKQHQTQS